MLSQNPPQEKLEHRLLLAYYINTYNAYTVDLILEYYLLPVSKISMGHGQKYYSHWGQKSFTRRH